MGCKQFSCSSRGWKLTTADLRQQRWQQGADRRVLFESLLQPRVNTRPHPRQRLVLAARGQFAVGGLQGLVLRYGRPECLKAIALQRAEL